MDRQKMCVENTTGISYTGLNENVRREPIVMGKRVQKVLKRDWQLLVLCALPVLYFIIFHYIPMYGVQIAFKDFKVSNEENLGHIMHKH